MLSTPNFWVAVSFVLFLLVLLYFRVPGRITAVLDRRAESIRNELEEARRLREEAQSILADYQRKHKEVEKEADEIVRLAREEAEALAAETRANLKESLDRRTKLAEEKIARAEAEAMNEVRNTAVEVATDAAERVIAQKMTSTASAKLVDDSIKGLKKRLN